VTASPYRLLYRLNFILALALILPQPVGFASPVRRVSDMQRAPAAPSVVLNDANLADATVDVSSSPRVYLPISLAALPDRPVVARPNHYGVQANPQSDPIGSVGDVIYVANSKQIGRTRNFSSASPTWISITGAFTGTIYDFVLDPLDPFNQA